MRWFFFFLLFNFVSLSAKTIEKPAQKTCDCRTWRNFTLQYSWDHLLPTEWRVSGNGSPTNERDALMHQVLDIEICGRLQENYARYKKWRDKWNPINEDERIYYDYSNFLVLKEYRKKSVDILLDWDLAENDILSKFEPLVLNNIEYFKDKAYNTHLAKRNEIAELLKDARAELRKVYEECRYNHRCLKTAYEYGLLSQHLGDCALSAQLMTEYAELASTLDATTPITPEAYLLCSESLLSALDYDKAVELLTQAIQKYPDRKELYEKRITAYLELGRYQDAAQDFISQDFDKDLQPDATRAELAGALLKGLAFGGVEGARDFPGSLLYSIRGATQMVWATVSHPIAVPAAIMKEVENAMSLLCKGKKLKLLEKVSPELHEIVTTWKTAPDREKWEKLGHYFGKNGFEIFACIGSVKLLKTFQTLRSKNALCTVKTFVSSPEAKIVEVTEELAIKRKSFFEKSKIFYGKQDKHREGTALWKSLSKDKRATNSILTHPDPEALLKKYAGKGSPKYHPSGKHPWEIGYKEDVNFGEEIGIWKSEDGKISGHTTWGRIHYDSKGRAHIVPMKPPE